MLASLPLGAERRSLSETAPWATYKQKRVTIAGRRSSLGHLRPVAGLDPDASFWAKGLSI